MKQGLAILLAAVVLLTTLCACGLQNAPAPETTATETVAAVPAVVDGGEDDVALPQENVDGATTTAVVAQTTAIQPAAIVQELATAPHAPETTTAPPTETAPTEPAEETPAPDGTSTTTQPPETTTAKPASAELLESSVLKPIRSGTYTETISAFLKDKAPEDKVSKIVRNGQTAFQVTVPKPNLAFKVCPVDGKYYLVSAGKYCELTKSQYDSICGKLNSMFFDFSSLQYKGTETVRDGLRKYTREDFTINGNALSLWYSGGALFKMEMDTGDGKESLPITVTGAADNGAFAIGSDLEQVDYSVMESLVSMIDLFF